MVGYVEKDLGTLELNAFLHQLHDLVGTPADRAVHLE